jgi:carboxypeptidase C (cathepsin A)
MRRFLFHALALAAVFFLMAANHLAAFQEETAASTRHQILIDGKALQYTAEAGRIAIRDVETGEPHGYIFHVSYRVPSEGKTRPVTFVWNGGPGANSSLLHFNVAGPKRLDDGRLVENPETWLTVTDLVFVDPIGTGFSRPCKAEYSAEFYGTLGDTASVTEFVRSWRLLHGADDAPIYLAGESWGAPRAATVGYALLKRGVPIQGLVLISGGTGLNRSFGSAELRESLRVMDFAAAAFYNMKLSPSLGPDLGSVRMAAETWARESYAPALATADRLSESERAGIIKQLSRFTGIAPDWIDTKTMRVTPKLFQTTLLKDEGKTLQTFDLRKTVPAGTQAAPSERAGISAMLRYLHRDLLYQTNLPYIGLESWEQGFTPSGKYPQSVGARWNYATAQLTPEEISKAVAEAVRTGDGPPRLGPPLPATEEALALNPRMRVLVASGLYDGFTPCAMNEETGRNLPPALKGSIEFKCYTGGHMMYLDPPARLELSRDIKAMITASK